MTEPRMHRPALVGARPAGLHGLRAANGRELAQVFAMSRPSAPSSSARCGVAQDRPSSARSSSSSTGLNAVGARAARSRPYRRALVGAREMFRNSMLSSRGFVKRTPGGPERFRRQRVVAVPPLFETVTAKDGRDGGLAAARRAGPPPAASASSRRPRSRWHAAATAALASARRRRASSRSAPRHVMRPRADARARFPKTSYAALTADEINRALWSAWNRSTRGRRRRGLKRVPVLGVCGEPQVL